MPTIYYDAAVIGSGIGGLTAASYLAKAGLRVLVVEKHYVAGGYAGSFTKRGYYFDAGAHYLGSCRARGQVGRLIADHDLTDKVQLIRCDPSDVLILGDMEVRLYGDYEKLVGEYQSVCQAEAHNVRRFMDYMSMSSPLQLYAELRTETFDRLLDRYFRSEPLKSFFCMPLGNVGLPSRSISALAAVLLYREFIFDGGYYPRGGMQRFADALVERIREYGGEVRFLTPASSIDIRAGEVRGLVVRRGGRDEELIRTHCVIANCDFRGLIRMLPEQAVRAVGVRKRLETWTATISAFMLHLGVRHDITEVAKHKCNVWYYPSGNVDEYYNALVNGEMALERGFLFYSAPSFHDPNLLPQDRHCIQSIIGAPYQPRSFWERDRLKERIAEEIIRRIERFIPGLASWIEVQQIAIPPTLEKYTGNYQGAMYGWASTPEQLDTFELGECFGVSGLFLVGHWGDLPTGRSGIGAVAAAGRRLSRFILRNWANGRESVIGTGLEQVKNTKLGSLRDLPREPSASTNGQSACRRGVGSTNKP